MMIPPGASPADIERLRAFYGLDRSIPEQFISWFGQIFSGKHLIADEVATNLPVTAPRLGTAYVLIQGRDDVISPTKAAMAYFQKPPDNHELMAAIRSACGETPTTIVVRTGSARCALPGP